MGNNRITCVIGAGAALGFQLPKNITLPSTGNITNKVREPYNSCLNRKNIDIVEDMYQHLVKYLPVSIQNSQPYVHFEMLFHVLEMYFSYGSTWNGNCKNPYIFPIFAPFTQPTIKYDVYEISHIMREFIKRIFEIVKGYDDYFANDGGNEDWYRNFFRNAPGLLDVFNFNYDTTIEQALGEGNYEDGFELIANSDYCEFLPQKLFANERNLSTINHLHGCIKYFYERMTNRAVYQYRHNDLFKYKDSDTVLNMMIGHSQSSGTNQTNEEIFAGPIITGLRKTDKLNCIPYDYYHANLSKSLIANKRLLITGYSFGDLYMNQQLERMDLIHGKDCRIVLIDYWERKDVEQYNVSKFFEYTLSPRIAQFLMMMCEEDYAANLPKRLSYKDVCEPMFSDNGRVMVLACGLREAVTKYSSEIHDFLK
mgnify:CR=1 FL=1